MNFPSAGKVLGAEDPAGSKGLLKWKGVMFAPNDETTETSETEEHVRESTTESAAQHSISENGNEVNNLHTYRNISLGSGVNSYESCII